MIPHDRPAGAIRILTPSPRARVRVVEIDGCEGRTTSRDALAIAGIADGDLLTASALECALEGAELTAATRRALGVLARRELSRAELHRKLVEDGYPETISHEVVTRSADLGLVDDERFAEIYVRSKAAARWGRERIASGLASAGIESETARAALDHTVPIEGEVDRASSLLGRTALHDRAAHVRHVRRLVMKGFRFQDARDAVNRSHTRLRDDTLDQHSE